MTEPQYNHRSVSSHSFMVLQLQLPGKEILRKFVARSKAAAATGSRGFQDSKGQRGVNDTMLSDKEQGLMYTQIHTLSLRVQCLEGKVIWPNTKLLSQAELLTRAQNKRAQRLNNRKSLRKC